MVFVLLGQKQPHEMPLSPHDVVSLALDPGAVVFLASQMARQHLAHLDELEQLLIASCMAGQAFTQVGLHLGHAIAHGVGVYGHVHHGTACALVLPYALSSVSEVIPDRIARIGKILGAEIQAQAAPKEIGRIVSDSLQSFNRSIGIGRLSDYGVTEEQLDSMAEYAIHEGGTQGNSFRPSPKAEVVEYLKSIL